MLCRSSVQTSEYEIADDVPTDIDPTPSAIITLGEEALQWQKTDSDSDSGDDYVGDGMDTGGMALVIDEGQFDSYMSGSSVSDSDEEFTLPYYRRRGAKTGRGGRRGRSAGGSSRGDVKSELVPMSVDGKAEVVGYTMPYLTSGHAAPPLLLPKAAGGIRTQSLVKKIHPPSLIKAISRAPQELSTAGSESGVAIVGSSVAIRTNTAHIQPPPGLIMPSVQQVDGVKGPLKHLSRRQPPPLVKKGGDELGHIPIQPKVYHPQIVLPSSEGESSSSSSLSPKLSNSTGSHSQSRGLTHASSYAAVSAPSAAPKTQEPPPPMVPVKRRPGRPRKDQQHSVNAQTKKTTAHVGLNKQQQKSKPTTTAATTTSTRRGRGQGAAQGKGIKTTQYDFQSQQQLGNVGMPASHGVAVAQQSSQHSVASNSQQFQPLLISTSGAPITPLQIINAGSAQSSTPMHVQTYSSVPQGGVIYLQGATPSPVQEQPTYITKDGQLFLIQPTRNDSNVDNAKKISVIMQPQAGVGPTYIQAGEAGNFHYVTQLDGPPPTNQSVSGVGCLSRGREALRRQFELTRNRTRARAGGDVVIQQLDGPVPRVQAQGRKKHKAAAGVRGTGKTEEMESCDGRHGSCDNSDRLFGAGSSSSSELQASAHVTCHLSHVTPVGEELGSNSNNNCNGPDSENEGGVVDHMACATDEHAVALQGEGKEGEGGGTKPDKLRKRGKKGRGAPPAKRVCPDTASVSPSPPHGGGHAHRSGSGKQALPSAESPGSVEFESLETAPLEGGCSKGRGRPRTSSVIGGKVYICKECGVTYTTRGGLAAHMATKHHPDLAVSTIRMHVFVGPTPPHC